MTTLLDRSLRELAALLERGEVAPGELLARAVERHAALGERLDAYQVWGPGEATPPPGPRTEAPRAPLAGLPVSVKDLFGVAGRPTFAGTARRLPEKWEREGPLVRELRRQGAVIVGKTRMVELAFGGLGTNPHWGTPRNPWDARVRRVPGGSSSGAGVSLQEGSALLAFGTDTACSARTPAAWTGTVGWKPTRGHWSTEGFVPLSPTLDTVGLLARSVEDVVFAAGALDPPHDPARVIEEAERRSLEGVTFGVVGSAIWGLCPEDVFAPVLGALRELEARGATLRDVGLPEFDQAYELYVSGHVVTPECAAFVARELPEWAELLHETVAGRLRGCAGLDSPEHRGALERRSELIEAARAGLREADVFVVPTVPISAPTLAEVEPLEGYSRLNRLTSRGTNPVNVLDLCALTLPCGLDAAGIPVGMQLVGRHGEDRALLACGLAVERVLGTPLERIGRPPLCA